MDDQPRYRTLIETKEYSAQLDLIGEKYSSDVIRRVLSGVMWGIATNPQAYDRVLGNIRVAKTRALGLTLPTFRIFFNIEQEGQDNEHVLLCWIEEASTIDEATEYLM